MFKNRITSFVNIYYCYYCILLYSIIIYCYIYIYILCILLLLISIYIYIYVCVYIYIHIYIYNIYIYISKTTELLNNLLTTQLLISFSKTQLQKKKLKINLYLILPTTLLCLIWKSQWLEYTFFKHLIISITRCSDKFLL